VRAKRFERREGMHILITSIFLPIHLFAHSNPMPISTSAPLRRYSQDDFGNVAYEVVRHAFKIHDALGLTFHESVYRSTLQRIPGPRATEELQITLTHQGFQKELHIDLVIDPGCPFELKAASCLTEAHQSQLIQYLMPAEMSSAVSSRKPNGKVNQQVDSSSF